jgi:hypothetical protein
MYFNPPTPKQRFNDGEEINVKSRAKKNQQTIMRVQRLAKMDFQISFSQLFETEFKNETFQFFIFKL